MGWRQFSLVGGGQVLKLLVRDGVDQVAESRESLSENGDVNATELREDSVCIC